MDQIRTPRGLVVASLSAVLVGTLAGSVSAQDEPVTLTYLVDSTEDTTGAAQALADAYHGAEPRTSRSTRDAAPAAPRATTSSRPASRPAR